MDELVKAIGKVTNGKAGGSSGILPEMITEACNDTTFFELILDMTQTAWKESKVLQDWSEVPILRRIIQERLQDLAEEELPESQCGFRRSRGCSDMIFTVRQLVEKSWEH